MRRHDDLNGGGRGAFVVLVGPDGVGKTTVARAMLDLHAGPTGYFHFRPPLRQSRLAGRVPDGTVVAANKHHRGSRPAGWLRLARSATMFWLGYLCSVRPLVRRGTLVVGDRWAYGYLVQPTALRYFGPPWLARVMLHSLPTPDLVVVLIAPAELIYDRKHELSLKEIRSELTAWSDVTGNRLLRIENVQSPFDAAKRILDEILTSPRRGSPLRGHNVKASVR